MAKGDENYVKASRAALQHAKRKLRLAQVRCELAESGLQEDLERQEIDRVEEAERKEKEKKRLLAQVDRVDTSTPLPW